MTAATSTPFVVTGCGRSGTGFTATVLDRVGHPCGHERSFTARTTSAPRLRPGEGDASWLAAPFLADLPSDAVVLHQVRDPREVVRSFLGIGFFEPITLRDGFAEAFPRLRRWCTRDPRRTVRSDFLRAIERAAPDVLQAPDARGRSVRYWVRWNRLVEGAAERFGDRYLRYRLEDLGPGLLGRIDRLLGGRADERAISTAIDSTSTVTNSRRRGPEIGWDDLRSDPAWDELHALAHRYGYDPDEDR